MEKHEFVELAHAVIKLGASERTIRRRIEEGDLFARKVGKKWYVQIPLDSQAQSGVVNIPLPVTSAPAHLFSSTQTNLPAANFSVPAHEFSGSLDDNIKTHPETERNNTGQMSKSFKRPRDSNRTEHQPDPNDKLDKHFSVGRLAAWSKVRLLQGILTDSIDQADCDEAAAALLEGYLGYGEQKIDSYRLCRSILCRLATRMSGRGDGVLLDAVSDALGASHALVITLNRRNERQTGRSPH